MTPRRRRNRSLSRRKSKRSTARTLESMDHHVRTQSVLGRHRPVCGGRWVRMDRWGNKPFIVCMGMRTANPCLACIGLIVLHLREHPGTLRRSFTAWGWQVLVLPPFSAPRDPSNAPPVVDWVARRAREERAEQRATDLRAPGDSGANAVLPSRGHWNWAVPVQKSKTCSFQAEVRGQQAGEEQMCKSNFFFSPGWP